MASEVDALSGTVVNTELTNTVANGIPIAEVAESDSVDPNAHTSTGFTIP